MKSIKVVITFLIILAFITILTTCDLFTAQPRANVSDPNADSANSTPEPITRIGLVGEWLFNGNANDTSGNNNNGTVTGATPVADRFGTLNSAYSFNNDKISCPALNLPGDMTITMWIKPFSVPAINGYVILEANAVQYRITIGSGRGINYDQYPPSSGGAYSAIPLNLNEWYFVGVVFQSTIDSVNIYINDSKEAFSHTEVYSGGTPASLEFGWSAQQNGAYYDGIIDNIRIYDRVLSDAEIQTLYLTNE